MPQYVYGIYFYLYILYFYILNYKLTLQKIFYKYFI